MEILTFAQALKDMSAIIRAIRLNPQLLRQPRPASFRHLTESWELKSARLRATQALERAMRALGHAASDSVPHTAA